ncbi:MAG TPA: hypothetical protein VHQ02_13465 [Usitatibacter sp.]|jgi:hypothetical protein|nr:hypothetical protein [Usitatibacter sp.]
MTGSLLRFYTHEAKFFELAGDLTVEVEFMVADDEAAKLLEAVRAAGVRTLFARVPAEFGVIEGAR